MKMNMKFKQVLSWLVISAGIIMSMTACSKSEDPVGPGPDDKELGEGYISLLSQLGSISGVRGADEDGTANESKVNRVRIVLYDAVTNEADYAYDYDGTALHSTGQDFEGSCMLDPDPTGDAPAGYSPSAKQFMPQAMVVKVKDYKMLVLINPSNTLASLTSAANEYKNIPPSGTPTSGTASTTADFRKATGSTQGTGNDLTAFIGKPNYVDPSDPNAPNNFLMSNSQEFIDVKEAQLQPTLAEAYAKPVVAKVDRAVAKVSLQVNYAAVSTASSAVVSDGYWKLDITNKTSFWMRHMTKALKGATEGPTTLRENYYAEDTNFDKYSFERYTFHGNTPPSDLIPSSAADIKTFFNYIDDADVTSKLENDEVSYEYALENTMAAGEQYEDVTTAAILKIKYAPAKTALGNTLGTVPYFVWGEYVFTGDELKDIRDYDADLTPNPDFDKYLALQKYLKDNKATLEATDGTGFGTDFGTPGTASKEVGEIQFNFDGINYYRILIRHFNDTQENGLMAYGRYGVVRNNYYKLTLKSIGAPGSIKKPGPNGPDDKKLYLGVSIEVLPWVVREQPVDIE